MLAPEPLQQVERTWVLRRGRRLSYFSGCDYFRLSSHPLVVEAFHRGAERYGLNIAASRLTTGEHEVYQLLEAEIGRFFDAPSAVLVSSGYQSAQVVAQALAGAFTHALLDSRAHPSLRDAAAFLECPTVSFGHRDTPALQQAVTACGPDARPIVFTDGLFAHDGSVAPLQEYLRILPEKAFLLVDDAHGAGVLGQTGKGTPEHCGISRDRIIQTITLSKAFGAWGGAIVCSPELREKILIRSRAFAGSTAPPLPYACAALESLHLLGTDPDYRQRLRTNMNRLAATVGLAGSELSPGPIFSWRPASETDGDTLAARLFGAIIFPQWIRYPGGPATGYFRFAISSEHSPDQMRTLKETLDSFFTGQRGTLGN
jgi:7-keto-8-aminopelargonate synthetase-like enzyme